MYKVFCDGYTLHDPSLNDIRYQLIDPVLTQEANKASGFTFSIPKTHANGASLQRLKSVITAYDDDKLIFRGRILNDTRDWDDTKQVVCEGDLAMLNDTVQRPYSFSGTAAACFTQLIANHNSQVEQEKRFTVGTVDVPGAVDIEVTAYSDTWKEIEDKLVNKFEGYLFVTWTGSINRIDWLTDSPYRCEQKITFGENLLDITRERKGEDIITALIPLGAKNEETGQPLTIKSINDNKDYIIDQAAANVYGIIYGTETWDNITSAAQLLLKGQERLAEISQGITTTQLTAMDLHLLDSDISSFDFMSYVTVEDPVHDISGDMLITRKTTHLADPSQGTLTIGKESRGISQFYSETSAQIQKVIETYATKEEVETVNTTLQSEIQMQADKIAIVVSESAGGYVIKAAEIVTAINESGSTVKISADHVAIDGSVIVSMINEGSTTINGSKITTGTINGDRIIVGTLSADAIGTGKLTVRDENNNILFDANIAAGAVRIAGFTIDYKSMEHTVSEPSGTGVLSGHENVEKIHVGGDKISRDVSVWEKFYDDLEEEYVAGEVRYSESIGNDEFEDVGFHAHYEIVDTGALGYGTYSDDAHLTAHGVKVNRDFPGDIPGKVYSELTYKALYMTNGMGPYSRITPTGITLANSTYSKTITASGPTLNSDSGSATVTSGSSYQTLGNISFPKGTYLIAVNVNFPANATGRRTAVLSSTMNSGVPPSELFIDSRNAVAAGGSSTNCKIIAIRSFSEPTTMYINAYQNSGGDLVASYVYQYVRLV